MNSCKPMDTLIYRCETLSLEICPKIKKEKEQMSQVSYYSAIGSLIYTMTCGTIGLVSIYKSNSERLHCAKRQ